MNEPSTEWTKSAGNSEDHDYHGFLRRLQDRFESRTAGYTRPLFQTDTSDLWDVYLAHFKDDERQFHNCSACRRFIREYGGLVTIDEDGKQRSAMWHSEDAPRLYKSSVDAAMQLVTRAPVVGPYLSSDPTWGYPLTGVWRHMALAVPGSSPTYHTPRALTARQRMAEMRQDFGSVARALSEYTAAGVVVAVTLLEADALYRSEKVLGAAKWLFDRHKERERIANKRARDNLLWRAIATAPQGFCHPRSSMIGTLLDDIEAYLPFGDVEARFKAKMHPLTYQRPQTAPSRGNITASEKLIEKLGCAASLRRRYARLDELQTVWTTKPVADAVEPASVFGAVEAKDAKPKRGPMKVPAQAITWASFLDKVLPTVDSMSLHVPSVGAFAAYVTALDPDAPPILQWDTEAQRNPVSWYQYTGGSLPAQWSLSDGDWVAVTALSYQPCVWHSPEAYKHFGEGVLFVLEGAKPDGTHVELGLFPELLKSDLHSARATIEAYSKSGKLADAHKASACGVLLQPNSAGVFPLVRVVTSGHVAQYKIDRWA